MKENHNHYFKPCPYDTLDVYRVISIFGVSDPCIQHALKKMLCSGVRGHKDQSKDIQDVIDTLERWKQMRCEDDKVENKPSAKVSEAVADNTSPLKPWYPDDSGDWVEYDGSGQPVEDDVLVEAILLQERQGQSYASCKADAGDWCWDCEDDWNNPRWCIVAYKVVKQ